MLVQGAAASTQALPLRLEMSQYNGSMLPIVKPVMLKVLSVHYSLAHDLMLLWFCPAHMSSQSQAVRPAQQQMQPVGGSGATTGAPLLPFAKEQSAPVPVVCCYQTSAEQSTQGGGEADKLPHALPLCVLACKHGLGTLWEDCLPIAPAPTPPPQSILGAHGSAAEGSAGTSR